MNPAIGRHIAVFLLAIMAYFHIGTAMFMHTHELFDGRTVAHSHPFLPGSHHGHSDVAITSLADLCAAMVVVAVQDIALSGPTGSFVELVAVVSAEAYARPSAVCSLRAPPCTGF